MKVLIVNNIPREGPGFLKDIFEEYKIEFYTYEFEKIKYFLLLMDMMRFSFLVDLIVLTIKLKNERRD